MKRGATFQGTVVSCHEEVYGAGIYHLIVKLYQQDRFAVAAGQFVLLESLVGGLMNRPFSVVWYQDGMISFLIRVVGRNTTAYSQLRPGDRIRVIGPQGKPFPIHSDRNQYLLVLGGVGGAAATMYAHDLKMAGKDVAVILGAVKPEQLCGLGYFELFGIPVETITDKGPGRTGFVTELLEERLKKDGGVSQVVSCGPLPMNEEVARLCLEYGNPCRVVLEERMACGTGSCKGCAVRMVDGTVAHVCEDGPSFDAERLDWSELVRSHRTASKTGCGNVQLVNSALADPAIDLAVWLGDVRLGYPIINCSGCLSSRAIQDGKVDISHLGALVTKGVSLPPRLGNVMPRVQETVSGMINAIGLENVGIDKFIADELSVWLSFGLPVFVNVFGNTVEEFCELVRRLEDTEVAGLELNISCPNVKEGGMIFGCDPHMAAAVTRAARKVTKKLLIVKLTPNVTRIRDIAEAVVDAGADVISLVNTITAMDVDILTRRPQIGNIIGGLSGPAIQPIALRLLYEVYEADLGVMIIAMGGIVDVHSAAKFFILGANVVAVGSGVFQNRLVFTEIVNGLPDQLKRHQFTSIRQLTGSRILPDKEAPRCWT